MDAVIDSVCMSSLLRSITATRRNRGSNIAFETALDSPLRAGKCRLCLDSDGALQDEWGRTCGEEIIRRLMVRWYDFGAIAPVDPANKIPGPARGALRQLGFDGTTDKLILRIAINTFDKLVVSNESDFWDPSDTQKSGSRNAPVAKICREKLGVTIMLLRTFLQAVK